MTARRFPFRKRIVHALEAAGAYAVFGFFGLLPLDAASALGGWAFRTLGPRMGVSRTALKNISRAFPEKTDAARREILRGMWDNLGRTLAEYPHLHRIMDRVGMEGAGHLGATARGIFFSGHLGNWEVLPQGFVAAGVESTLVYRRPNNPWIDGLLRGARGGDKVRQIAKGSAGAREIMAVLKRGRSVGMLVDQKLNEGVPVPFFGRDVMTADAPAQFALRLGAPLHPMRVERLDGARFRMTLYPALPVAETGDRAADARRVLCDINAVLEGWIRERPEQWLWTHRRWPDETP